MAASTKQTDFDKFMMVRSSNPDSFELLNLLVKDSCKKSAWANYLEIAHCYRGFCQSNRRPDFFQP
jgi:hypothetical protein